MTIEEIYKWAVKHDCEKHTLWIYCNQTDYDYCEEGFDVDVENLEIHTVNNDPDNFDRENFVEIDI